MMNPEYDDIHDRLLKTIAVQEKIATDWLWEEKTVAQWNTLKASLEATRTALDQAEAAETLSVGALSSASSTLHNATKQALGLAKIRFRNQPDKLVAFANLRAAKTSIATIQRAADDLAAAWLNADPTGSYAGVSLADYNTKRMALAQAVTVRTAAQAGTKLAQKRLKDEKIGVYKDLIAWYAAATKTYPEITQIGGLVRADIPT